MTWRPTTEAEIVAEIAAATEAKTTTPRAAINIAIGASWSWPANVRSPLRQRRPERLRRACSCGRGEPRSVTS